MVRLACLSNLTRPLNKGQNNLKGKLFRIFARYLNSHELFLVPYNAFRANREREKKVKKSYALTNTKNEEHWLPQNQVMKSKENESKTVKQQLLF